MNDDDDFVMCEGTSVTIVDAETWAALLAWLDEGPKPDPRLVELFRKAKIYPTVTDE